MKRAAVALAVWAGLCAGQQKEAAGRAEGARPAAGMQNAIERQQESVQRQMEAMRAQYPSFWARPPLAARPEGMGTATPEVGGAAKADCAAAPWEDLRPIIDREAGKHSVDASLVEAVVETESAFKPCAVSPKGAKGLMQLMPATMETFGVGNPFDMKENIAAGTAFLRQLLDKYGGDRAKALAAYNAGPARVDSVGGIPDIAETREYVKRILDKLARDKPAAPDKIQ